MKIGFYLDSPNPWNSGIWYHRNKMPSEALMTRGHLVRHFAIGTERPRQDVIDAVDTIIFGRTYPVGFQPIEDMKAFKKAGKRVLYDIDDDFWAVAKDNPSVLVSNSLKDQYEGLIRECDAVITPSKVLAKKIQKLCKGKPVFICPNGINYEDYRPRARTSRGDDLFIGYMGAASHWDDLKLIVDVLEKLSEKYNFFFYLYGMTNEAFEAAAYTVRKIYQSNLQPEKQEYFKNMMDFHDRLKQLKMIHRSFMPPEIHPMMLSNCDFDIGLAPLVDTEFNRGKSCIKFYEYAATGTCCVASDVLPYSDEVSYRAKNTFQDWYNKIEKLIVDKDFRDKLQEEQSKWVFENRSIEAVALAWEKAVQLPGGLEVLNQQ